MNEGEILPALPGSVDNLAALAAFLDRRLGGMADPLAARRSGRDWILRRKLLAEMVSLALSRVRLRLGFRNPRLRLRLSQLSLGLAGGDERRAVNHTETCNLAGTDEGGAEERGQTWGEALALRGGEDHSWRSARERRVSAAFSESKTVSFPSLGWTLSTPPGTVSEKRTGTGSPTR